MAKKQFNLQVRARRNEPADRMIKRFIKKCKKNGIIDEMKERRHYKKPSEKRRLRNIKRKREIAKANNEEKGKR